MCICVAIAVRLAAGAHHNNPEPRHPPAPMRLWGHLRFRRTIVIPDDILPSTQISSGAWPNHARYNKPIVCNLRDTQ